MQQLALDVRLADYARFETFYSGANEAAVAAVKSAATQIGRQVHWLWGPLDSGRSHLLQAAVAAASEQGFACAWLPLDMAGLTPAMLEGMGSLDLLCVDNVETVAGDAAWERALFVVCEELRARNARLLVTAAMAMPQAGIVLRDLSSRLAAGPTWKLQALNDAELLAALQLRAHWRGFELPDDAGQYLLRRAERSSSALFALLDKLDSAALAAQRRITVPFVKSVLQQSD